MRLIPNAPHAPYHCAVLPWKTSDPEGFIDTGNEFETFPVFNSYVSVAAVREMAKIVGLPNEEEVQLLQAQVTALTERLQDAEERAERAESALDGIEGLTKADYVIRKKVGRPPKEKEPV